MIRRRRPSNLLCDACAAPLPPDAVWCGRCGARADGNPRAAADDDEPDGEPRRTPLLALDADGEVVAPAFDGPMDDTVMASAADEPGVGRRRTAVLAVTAVAIAAVFVRAPGPPPASFVARAGVATGLSSSEPPAVGLRLAWSETLVGAPDQGFSNSFLQAGVVRDGRAVLGDAVVDITDGSVLSVGWASPYSNGGAGFGAEVVTVTGDQMVIADRLTGEVQRRIELGEGRRLPGLVDNMVVAPGVIARGDGVTMVEASGLPLADGSFIPRVAIVRDDGSVVAQLEGEPYGYGFGAEPGSPYAVLPLPTVFEEGHDQLGGDLSLEGAEPGLARIIRLSDGAVVMEAALGLQETAHLRGDQLMTARDVGGDWHLGSGEPTEWDVSVVQLPGGEVLARSTVVSADLPTFLGMLGESPLVGVRYSRVVEAQRLERGKAQRMATVIIDRVDGASYSPQYTDAAQVFAVDDGRLVVSDEAEGQVYAVDEQGRELWRFAADRATGLAAYDGHVAVALARPGGPAQETRSMRLHDAVTGRQVAAVTMPPSDTVPSVVAEVDGVIGVGSVSARAFSNPTAMNTVRWLDVRDGGKASNREVFEPWVAAWRTPSSPADSSSAPVPSASPGADELERRLRALELELARGELVGLIDEDGVVAPVVVRRTDGDSLLVYDAAGGFEPIALPVAEGVGADELQYYGYFIDVLGLTAEHLVLQRQSFDGQPEVLLAPRSGGEVRSIAGVEYGWVIGDLLLAIAADERFESFGLAAIDLATGDRRWEGPTTSGIVVPHGDAELIVIATEGVVLGHRAADGAEAWRFVSDVLTSDDVTIHPSHVTVLSSFGEVISLDRETGEERWRTRVGAVRAGAVTGAGDHLVLGTADGMIVHLDADGAVVERVRAVQEMILGITVVDGAVVVVTNDRVIGMRADGRGVARDLEVDLP